MAYGYRPYQPRLSPQMLMYLQAQQRQQQGQAQARSPLSKLLQAEGGKSGVESLASSLGIGGGSGLASTAGENAAYNAAAMEASGAPMTLVEPGLTATAPGPLSFSGIGSAGNVFLPAAGAIGAFDVLKNDRGPVRGGLQGAASGAAIGSYFGPPGILPGAVIGGTIGLGKGLLGNHKTTREVAKGHTKDLLSQNPNDAAYQSYVKGMREQYNAPPPDPSKPFAGKYGSWGEYEKAGLEAGDLTGVHGNLKTFGTGWTGLTEAQRKAVTQGIIDAGLYKSKKGEVEITDSDKAKSIFDELSKKGFSPPASSSTPSRNTGPAPVTPQAAQVLANAIPRTNTRSPGIDLQGRRIRY